MDVDILVSLHKLCFNKFQDMWFAQQWKKITRKEKNLCNKVQFNCNKRGYTKNVKQNKYLQIEFT